MLHTFYISLYQFLYDTVENILHTFVVPTSGVPSMYFSAISFTLKFRYSLRQFFMIQAKMIFCGRRRLQAASYQAL